MVGRNQGREVAEALETTGIQETLNNTAKHTITHTWLDCKSVVNDFDGSNPSSPTIKNGQVLVVQGLSVFLVYLS